jgi:HK97 gp10 family phage protein
MPNAVSWTVSGLSELTQKLGSLPDKIEKKVLRSAVSSGAKVIRDDARSRIHSKKGNLVEGIRFTTSVKLGQGLAVSRIFVSKKKAFYGRFVEFGTLPTSSRAGGSQGSRTATCAKEYSGRTDSQARTCRDASAGAKGSRPLSREGRPPRRQAATFHGKGGRRSGAKRRYRHL